MAGPNVRITTGSHGTFTKGLVDALFLAPEGKVITGVQTLSETTFGASTNDLLEHPDGDGLVGLTVPAGIYMEGRWDGIQATGTVRLYFAPA